MTLEYSTEQKAIFNWFTIGRRNLMIQAYAGSGKTETLVQGLERATAPSALYVVFNKVNAVNTEKRITNKKVIVKTLHSVGFQILRNHWRGVMGNRYVEYERIQSIHKEAPKQFLFQAARLVSFLKNVYINPTLENAKKQIEIRDINLIKSVKDSGWNLDKLAEAALKSIELSKSYPINKKISFEDMIWLPCHLGIIKPCYHLVAVDELQDLNEPQMEMVQRLCLPEGKICGVGDALQSIYFWRGSLSNCMDIFKEKLNAKVLSLKTSYRLPKVISESLKKYAPEIKSADWAIDGEISEEKTENLHKVVKPNDFVLSRTNSHLVKVCLGLLRKKIPAYIEGKEMSKHLCDIIDLINAKDINSFFTGLDSWLAARQPVNVTPRAAANFATHQDEAATLRFLAEQSLTIDDIKKQINSLFYDSENVRVPSTILMTCHKAKGRESNATYLIKSSFISRRTMSLEEQIEERNIRYVAESRSKNKLIHLND